MPKNSHIIALDIASYVSADQSANSILKEIRRQGGLSIACHPHHRTTRRIEISTCYLWDHRDELLDLVDVWEAGNRDDLFSVTSLKHFPYVANNDFDKINGVTTTLTAALRSVVAASARLHGGDTGRRYSGISRGPLVRHADSVLPRHAHQGRTNFL